MHKIFHLSLTASICFEQLYNGVDGDSASSTELYGLLSSLSGIPIKQAIAVTGSVNQKGQIQPIGGVNEKIEGYFQICKMLDGSHGVMIPVYFPIILFSCKSAVIPGNLFSNNFSSPLNLSKFTSLPFDISSTCISYIPSSISSFT